MDHKIYPTCIWANSTIFASMKKKEEKIEKRRKKQKKKRKGKRIIIWNKGKKTFIKQGKFSRK
jgi:hypothetical protein